MAKCLCILTIAVWYFFKVVDSDPCQTVQFNKSLDYEIQAISPPIWHTNYYQRDGMNWTDENIRRLKLFLPEDYVYGDTNILPTKCVSYNAMEIVVACRKSENAFGESVRNGSLSAFNKLTNVLIQNCDIRHLTSVSFRNLTRLSTLLIQYSNIEWIDEDALHPMINLRWFEILGGSLKTLALNNFCLNPRLKFLQVKNTGLQDIDISVSSSCKFENLNSLVLDGSNLGSLNNSKLSAFRLDGVLILRNTSIVNLSEQIFQDIPHLLSLDLSNNIIGDIPEGVFSPMKCNLQFINLTSNRIKTINTDLNFGPMNLTTLMISYNQIERIIGSFGNTLFPRLMDLDLSHNCIQSIDGSTFSKMGSIKHLKLNSNNISKIDIAAFQNNTRMKTLDLSSNNLLHFEGRTLYGLISLQIFDVSDNHLSIWPIGAIQELPDIKILNMSRNGLQEVTIHINNNTEIEVVDLSHYKLEHIPLIISPYNKSCDLLKHLQTLNLNHNKLMALDEKVICLVKHVRVLDLSYNFIDDIEGFPSAPNLQEFYFQNNEITKFVSTSFCAQSQNITIIDISYNRITVVEEGVFYSCRRLKELWLQGNQLKVFQPPFPLGESPLQRLGLAGNPLRCSCDNRDLQQWLFGQTVSVDNVTCDGGDRKKLRVLRAVDFKYCDYLYMKILIPVGVVVLLLFIGFAVVYRFRYPIQVIALYKWNIRFSCCFRGNKNKNSGNFKYDAFVCFSEDDAKFVQDVLIPILEPRFTLLVKHRDFPVGNYIADATLEAIDDSEVTIVLLSANFMNSHWGTFEFKEANYRAMRSTCQRLLVVVMDDEVLRMEIDTTLKSILYTKAYLRRDDDLFREKLVFSMPRRRLRKREARVENAVDENTPLIQ